MSSSGDHVKRDVRGVFMKVRLQPNKQFSSAFPCVRLSMRPQIPDPGLQTTTIRQIHWSTQSPVVVENIKLMRRW
jgi:hypothetical protein